MEVLLDVPITFQGADDQPTHAPMVLGAIGTEESRFIVDTGSSDHILTAELADRVGLEAEPGEEGIDSTGASVPSWTLGNVPITIHDHAFTLSNVVAITAPPPFVERGIGGILSPQHLHASAWVVLDMAGDRLIMVEGVEADVGAWLAARMPGFQPLTLERASDDPTILVHASIDPYGPVVALLDTGGKGTEVVTSAVPGLVGGELRSIGRGVGGGEAFGAAVDDQVLRVAGASLPVPHLILRDQMDGREILIGMPVLRGTILTVSSDASRPVLWQVPAAS